MFSFYTPGYPSLLYGRWLRDYEQAPPAVWRKCFRARILEQMNGLSDDDPTNDTAACQKLAISLFQAGDRKNAGLILVVIFQTLEKYMAEKSRQTDAEPVVEEQNDTAPAVEETDIVSSEVISPFADEFSTNGVGNPLVGPHNSLLQRRDTRQIQEPNSNLTLYINSNAWNYTCDSCGLDAEDTGTM